LAVSPFAFLAEAEKKADQVEYLLMRLKQGYVQLPPGVAITDLVAIELPSRYFAPSLRA
jgi:hypothetical protein